MFVTRERWKIALKTIKLQQRKIKHLQKRLQQLEKQCYKLTTSPLEVQTISTNILQTQISSMLKAFPLRLYPGMEIKSSLLKFVDRLNLKAAFVLTCCGSVTKATLRYATGMDQKEKVETLERCFELTSLVGTLSAAGAHLHVTLGSVDGTTVSGHVVGDLIVQTTAEIVVGEIVGTKFNRVHDASTGWPELTIVELNKTQCPTALPH